MLKEGLIRAGVVLVIAALAFFVCGCAGIDALANEYLPEIHFVEAPPFN